MYQPQISIRTPVSYPWLAESARAIRITLIMPLLIGWFVVVGGLAVATVTRDAVIRRS